MEQRSIVIALFVSLGLPACGGSVHHKDAESADNVWADYKGTYATAAAPRTSEARASASPKKADAPAAATKAKSDVVDPVVAAPTPPSSKKASKATIHGESVSSIDLDALANFSKDALKANVVSTGGQVGPQYESVKVELKGTTVQIIRPAAIPNANGVAVPSPKVKKAALSKVDSGFYDEDADVLVVVTGSKNAKKALGMLVKH